MNSLCETVVRAAVAALQSDYLLRDEKTGDVSLSKDDLAQVLVQNVKVVDSSCRGPGDCDEQNPDSFTYRADIGKKGNGLNGQVVVSYHRGHCLVRQISLKQ